MNIRPKTVRRTLILALALTTLVAAGWWVYARNENARFLATVAERDAGLSAWRAGDYEPAMQSLGRYLARFEHDRDALFAYADCRRRIESPGGRHLAEAINTLSTRLLPRYPEDAEAVRLLIELYTETGSSAAAIELCERRLQRDPEDVVALRCRAVALSQTARVEDALSASLRYNAVQPGDLREQLRTMWLMWRARKSPEELRQRAASLLAERPDDPRCELVMAVACGYADDREGTLRHLRSAAARDNLDATVVRELVSRFDGLKLFEESRDLLRRAADRTGDIAIRRLLVSRLWQESRHDEVLRRLDTLLPSDGNADPALLAYKMLSQTALGYHDDAVAGYRALQSRRSDPLVRAWEQALSTVFAEPPPPPKEAILRLRGAMSRDRDNGLFRSWMGDAYWRLGETELAMVAWSEAAQMMPSWAEPLRKLSRAHLSVGAVDDALATATEAYRRSPTLESVVNLVTVRFRKLESSPREVDAVELLQQVRQVQAAVPFEPRTLPIEVALLARTDQRDRAIARTLEAISSVPPLDGHTLLNLAAVSRSEQLGLQQRIFDSAAPESRTPMLVLSRASDLAAAGKIEEAQSLLTTSAVEAGNGIEWQTAQAQFLESISHPSAARFWIELGDRHPNNLDVQRLILLSAESVRSDRAFVARTIERLRQLTGEAGEQWKLERAKWLLAGNEYDDSVQAVTLLTEMVQRGLSKPRIFLARALEQTGNVNTAIEHLKAASDADPRDPRPVLELVRLLRTQSKLEEVRRYAVRLARDGVLGNDDRLSVASLLVELGEPQRAIDLLAAAETRGANDPGCRVLLAELYRHRGRLSDADRLYDLLLSVPEPSAATMLSAADFYASTSRHEQASEVLKRLDEPRFSPATRALIMARFKELHGDEQETRELYARATSLAPENAVHWIRRAEFELARGRYAEATRIADEALSRGVNDARLASLRLEAEALQEGGDSPADLTPIIRALSRDPGRAPQVQMLTALQQARQQGLGDRETAARLREVADRYPRFLPLQQHMVRLYLQIGQTDDAVALALRTMDALPSSADAAELAVAAGRAAGRWLEVRQAAERWRQRGIAGGDAADAALAEAFLQLNQPSEALRVIEPRLAQLQADHGLDAELRRVATRALIHAGRYDEARQLLLPLVDESKVLRDLWLSTALGLPDATRTELWLSEVTPTDLSKLDPENARALGEAWGRLAYQSGRSSALERARSLLLPLARRDDASAVDLLRAGQLELACGNLDASEDYLRRSLRLSPEQPEAANNLAYVLLRRGEKLDEARALVEESIRRDGRVAAYHDTLARVQLAQGRRDEARKSFEQAVTLDSSCLDAWIGLAVLHHAEGRATDVTATLRKIDELLDRSPPPTDPVRRELDTLRAQVSQGTE